MANVAGDDGTAGSGAEIGKQGGFPAPITILALVLILVWAAAFFIPSGQYQLDAGGSPIAGSFQQIEPPLDVEGRVRDLLLAPVNGLYGIQDPATGQIGPFNSGIMFGSVQVFLFILAIGGFMTAPIMLPPLGSSGRWRSRAHGFGRATDRVAARFR